MPRVRISTSAAADLRDIRRWLIRGAGPRRAGAILQRIRDTARTYARYSQAGGSEDSFAPGVRSFVEAPYVVLYLEGGDGIALVRIIHGARDGDAALRERPLDMKD